MVKVQNFHEGLERDLERLTANVQQTKERPEAREWSEREVVKQSIRSFRESITPSQPRTDEKNEPPAEKKSPFLPTYLEQNSSDPRVKDEVQKLVEIVFQEGLERAVKEAKHHSAFVEDAFHDALADKLLPELKRRKII